MTKIKKPVISPAHAILILIELNKADLFKVEALKKLYLSGAQSPNITELQTFLTNHLALSEYQVSFNADIINGDPTRRYFETHLAYETLMLNIEKISEKDLESHFKALKDLVPLNVKLEIEDTLDGVLWKEDDNLSKEYASYIAQLKSGLLFKTLDTIAKNKIILLVKCSFLTVVNATYIPMPLDIYRKGIYSEESKGKLLFNGQTTTKNAHLGLMKCHMPLPPGDIAERNTVFPFLKPSDQATYVKESVWVKSNFAKLVHPFSNSIAGTMLAQLRAHLKLNNKNMSVFTQSLNKLTLYSQLSISAMLYYSGGHSLYEYVFPFTLVAVQEAFDFIPEFNTISLESMFLLGNEAAFTKALDATMDYQQLILSRKKLQIEIETRIPSCGAAMGDNTKSTANATNGRKRSHFFLEDNTKLNKEKLETDEKRARKEDVPLQLK